MPTTTSQTRSAAALSASVALVVLLGPSTAATAGGHSAPEAGPPKSAGIALSATAGEWQPEGTATATSPRGKCGTEYGTWDGDGITSQEFHVSDPEPINSYGAADFTCTGNRAARTISTIAVAGRGQWFHENFDFNITVFQTVQLKSFDAHQPADGRKVLCRTTGRGSVAQAGPTGEEWTIPLKRRCVLPEQMSGKVVWLEVQADVDFDDFGQWFWATQHLTFGDRPADWRNPDNYFDTRCLSYSADIRRDDVGPESLLRDCLPGYTELMFRIVA